MSPRPEHQSADEVPFEFEELFFSRTDENGIILSGNTVFQRVSGYSWDELIQKPHKIIRHPDTPRAVFWLLWDTIKQGEPIGAYVKNRAKDGRAYWVFAIVTPIEGGYLSVRLKPGSELLPTVKALYQSQHLAEERDATPPAESAALVLAQLAELGFSDYAAFMATALKAEITARDEQMGRPQDRTLALFEHLGEAGRQLLARTGTISEAYEKNEHTPLNFQILSARLGSDGAAISVVSENYETLSDELNDAIARFTESATQVCKAIYAGLFLVCTARMQQEILAVFKGEETSDEHSNPQEAALLDAQQKAYVEKARSSLETIDRQAGGFRQDCIEMKRLAVGLEVTRVMGKVEYSRLARVETGFDELLSNLEIFQTAIVSGLKDIELSNVRIEDDTHSLLGGFAAATRPPVSPG